MGIFSLFNSVQTTNAHGNFSFLIKRIRGINGFIKKINLYEQKHVDKGSIALRNLDELGLSNSIRAWIVPRRSLFDVR